MATASEKENPDHRYIVNKFSVILPEAQDECKRA
jgi:hypothetical protein